MVVDDVVQISFLTILLLTLSLALMERLSIMRVD